MHTRRIAVLVFLASLGAGFAFAGPFVPPLSPASGAAVPRMPVSPAASEAATSALGSAFTYQGLLRNGGSLAQGNHDFTFALYTDSTAGSQIGSTQSALNVSVSNGFFTVALDFGGAAFDGTARWLAISVRPAGGGSYTPLLPRQALRPIPYALRSVSGGASQWTTDANGIDYLGYVSVGNTANPGAKLQVDNGNNNSQAAYIVSQNGPWAALVVRNTGTNGWGIYDDTSRNHYLYGNLGLGQTSPGYPVDILNTLGGGIRIASTGSTLSGSYPGEGVRAAMFVHGYTGSGLFGASSGGIYASSTDARALSGWTTTGWGVDGNCTSSGCYAALGTPNEGMFAYSPSTSYPAAHFIAPSGGTAIVADGITKTKTLQILGGSDLAEPFDVTRTAGATPEAGSVVVIDPAHPGDLAVSAAAYDTRVAGVISGAGDLAPGMVMQSDGEHAHGDHPVALTGRVWCKVDASFGAVHPGDLLVTSPTPGHAMIAQDPARRGGAVLGKAMTALERGRGLVLVLVSLQ